MIFCFPSQAKLEQKVDDEYPKAALAFMQQQHIRGRIFNQYKFGGYMELHAPEYKTFIDGRRPIHKKRKFTNMLEPPLCGTHSRFWIGEISQYVLIKPDEPMVYLLKHSPAWRLVYSDNVAVLFERRAGAHD